jgi:ArsR family transcriptional regulator
MESRSNPAPPAHASAALPADEQALLDAAAMFRALADPERLRLLVRLAAGEASVSELAGEHKLTTVSARPQFLLAARLVRRRREARQIFYALADQHVIDLVANAMDHASERHEPTHRHHHHPEGNR